MGRLSLPVPLTADHCVLDFDCGIVSLNDWLIQKALKNEHGGGARTYVVCDDNRVEGYYAIAAGSVARRQAPGRVRRNMPDPIPALILGRLAVDRRQQGLGIGRGLLRDALARSLNVSRQVGARVLMVHALDMRAEAFYLKHGFTACPGISNTLLLGLWG